MPPTCFSVKYPYDGDQLQVMPWPELHHLSEHDKRAIYEYVNAIPRVALHVVTDSEGRWPSSPVSGLAL